MIQVRKDRSLKKYQGQAIEKRLLQRQKKKVKKTSQPKKAPKSPEFNDSSEEEEEGPPKNNKRKKMLPLLGVKEEVQNFFGLQEEKNNLTIKKKVEKVVFKAGPYEGYELSYIALWDTKYLKKVLKVPGLKKNKKQRTCKTGTAKDLTFFNLLHNHQLMSPATKTIRAHVYLATDPKAFPRKLKIVPKTLTTMLDNFSTAFPSSSLSASASLPNHPSSFSGEAEPRPPPPKTLAMTRKIVEMVIERPVSIGNMVMPYSRNKVQRIFLLRMYLYQEFFQWLFQCDLCLKIFWILW